MRKKILLGRVTVSGLALTHRKKRILYCKTCPPSVCESRDDGINIVAHKDELGFESPIIKVQVKGSEAASAAQPSQPSTTK